VRVAPPRTRLPLWAIAIAGLLVVNLTVVMWMLLRHQHASSSPGPQPVTAAATTPPATGIPVPVVATSAAAPATAPPVSAAAPGTAGAAAGSAAATLPTAPAAATAVSGTVNGAPDSANAEDYAPAEEPRAPGLGSRVRRGTASGVPLYQDVSATPGTQLPQLRLDLHVFAARPQDRFVMINMHKLREGDTLPEGVHLDSITPEGAVLSYNGSKFLLPRD
ncbi:MAG TPA: general secretion pathway protein GspB, partial [Steroidobacteraceae bacterium]